MGFRESGPIFYIINLPQSIVQSYIHKFVSCVNGRTVATVHLNILTRWQCLVVSIHDDSFIPGILFTPTKLCWRKHHDLHADLLRTVEIIWIWLVNWCDKWIILCVNHPPNDICDYCRQDDTNPNDDVAGQTIGFARQLPTKRISDMRNPVPNLVLMFSMTSWLLVS